MILTGDRALQKLKQKGWFSLYIFSCCHSLSSWISSATTDFDSSLEKENAAFGVAAAGIFAI